MRDIQAVLLVPAERDPLGLLAEGPCGARPPMAFSGATCDSHEGADRHAIPPDLLIREVPDA